MIRGIVCTSFNWGIGKKNGLLFNLKTDMDFFKRNTASEIVVMGENTLLSLPGKKPLKGRTNIVLCPAEHSYDDCICVHTFEDCLSLVQQLSKTNTVYIIGGGMLYRSMLPYYDSVFVTRVYEDRPDAEVFFPNLNENPNFYISYTSRLQTESDKTFQFVTYSKILEKRD